MTPTIQSLGDSATRLADQAAQAADTTIRSTQRVANNTLNGMADKVDAAHANAVPAIGQMTAEAERITQKAADALIAQSRQLRESAQRLGENSVVYIREKPVRAVLISAAAGAMLALIASAWRRSGR